MKNIKVGTKIELGRLEENKNAETENGELITVERFKEIILDKLRMYL